MKTKKDNIEYLDTIFVLAFAIIFQAINEFKKEKDIDKSKNLSVDVNERSVK